MVARVRGKGPGWVERTNQEGESRIGTLVTGLVDERFSTRAQPSGFHLPISYNRSAPRTDPTTTIR